MDSGVMFITWMKRAVSKEGDGGCKPLNILSLAIVDLNTSYAAQIWNLLQLSSAFVPMERVSNLVSYFLERSFIQSGFKLIMVLGETHHIQVLINLIRISACSVGMSENGWTDDFL